VNYFTLRTIIILMETIKDLYIARLPRGNGRSVARGAMRPARHMHDDVEVWQARSWYNADCAFRETR
jgi:hypothetical protein